MDRLYQGTDIEVSLAGAFFECIPGINLLEITKPARNAANYLGEPEFSIAAVLRRRENSTGTSPISSSFPFYRNPASASHPALRILATR
jgi:hypothetical protein